MNTTHSLPPSDGHPSCSKTTYPSRRQFLQRTGRVIAGSALAGVAIPHVHAAADETIRLAIIGCGPRGTGAVVNAFESPHGPCKLVAMADIFEDKLQRSFKSLMEKHADKMDVPPERRFIGFDGYKKAIDCLRPGDVALLTTRAAFRATHLEYAVQKGVNVFMEKSFAPDPVGSKRIIQAGQAAAKKNLKIGAGLQCRHSTARQAFIQKVKEGALGQILLIRAYRMQGGRPMGPRKPGENELLAQIRSPMSVLWSGAGIWMDNMIHQVDECCWLKDAWPISAHGVGGRFAHSTDCSQNLDSYAIEYTFADGTKAIVNGRFLANCYNEFATFVHGTKCAGQFSGNIHAPTVFLYQDQRLEAGRVAWQPEKETVNPWQAEWDNLLLAIRKDKPHNEAERAGYANLAAIMGRAAVHMGRIITWEEIMSSKFAFCPNVDTLTENSPAPVMPDAQGRYPAPVPGKWTEV